MTRKTESEKTGRRRDDGQGGLYWVWRTGRNGKRTKMWVGTVETGLDPRTGQRTRKYVYSVDKRRCADKLNDLREAVKANGGRAPDTRVTVSEWAPRWLETVQYDVDPSTFRNYRSLCNRWIVPTIGRRPLSKITAADADKLRRAMLDPKDQGGGGLSTSTAKQAQVALNLMLEQARREKLIADNPLTDVRAIKVSTVSRRVALTDEQAMSVWRCAISRPAGAGARHALQLMSGMRQGEHTGAVLEDLHLTGDGTGWYEVNWKLEALDREHGCQDSTGQVTCHLKRAAYCPQARWIKPDGFEGRHLEGAWWLTRPKHHDPGTVRAVPLSAAVVTAISQWLEATAHYDRRHGLIWCNEDGSPITPAQDNKELRALFAEAGVPAGLTGHVLRHSFVTIAAAQPGADINVIAKISGHSAKVAEGIYRHHTQEERRRAVAALAEAITKPEGTGGRTNPA
ncbi:tyrosine-type recombinase/integrase [Cellulosimicrobium funkei]|uniref:tyrosine-type recombinase/integrase n=1 Tax=Cellulosimicrobium funkei TaxID=264251 RepID=UPI003D738633